MKIGILVGAVGLALAAAAHAEKSVVVRPHALPMSNSSSITAESAASKSATALSADQLRKAREAAIGRPGTEKFARAVQGLKADIAAGLVDPRTVLFEGSQIGLEFEVDPDAMGAPSFDSAPTIPGVEQSTFRGAIGGSNINPPYAYFDGFETYNIDESPDNNMFSPNMNGQIQPGGAAFPASFMFAAVAANDIAMPANLNPLLNPPLTALPRDPFNGATPPGGDRSATIHQILMDGRGSVGTRRTTTNLGYNQLTDRLYEATAETAMIICSDWYFGDYEQEDVTGPVSFVEGFYVTRLIQSGVGIGDPLAPNDRQSLIQVLGNLPGSFTIGQFFAPPENPGGPPTQNINLNEWYSVAVRVETNTFQVFCRDSGTNGSGSVLINHRDLSNNPVPMFESGWTEIYPGKAPGAPTVMGGNTVYRGTGKARNQFMEPADDPAVLLTVSSCNGHQSVIFPDPTVAQLPNWTPTNHYIDNFCFIGSPVQTPPQPKLRLPYKDDIELYIGGGSLSRQGGRWNDALSSRAVIHDSTALNHTPPVGSNGDPTPQKSIRQTSIITDSAMRREFSTITTSSPRMIGTPADPVLGGAWVRLSNNTCVRGMLVNDNGFLGSGEFLLMGATGNFDAVTPRFYIRLANPLFDDMMQTPAGARVDDLPNISQNVAFLNWPTTTTLPVNSYFEATLEVNGNGTARFLVNGTPLTFDAAFYTMDPALEAELMEAKTIAGDVAAGYRYFLSDMVTVDEIEFWSGNNIGSLGVTINVDDICVDGPISSPGLGPEFELPYWDGFECYNLDEALRGQGDTPFILASSVVDVDLGIGLRNIRANWNTASFPANTQWCSYTVQEVIPRTDRKGDPLPDEWGVSVGNTVYVQKPNIVGFVCPERTGTAGSPNFFLVDPAEDGRRTAFLRVGASSMVTSSGAEANFRSGFDVYDPSSLFCRYSINSITALPNPATGGAPGGQQNFPCPNWTPGTIIAVDQLFAVGDDGVAECPGVLNTASGFTIFDAMDCENCEGSWTLISSAIPMGGVNPVGAAVPAMDSDIRGYGINFTPFPRWATLAGFASGGAFGDGWIRIGADELDDVKTALAGMDVSIDPMGEFGEVVSFINNNANAPQTSGATYISADALLPQASASTGAQPGDPDTTAMICWDLYVQDLNTRNTYAVNGDEGVVTVLRFGGPDPVDGVPATNIAFQIRNPGTPPPTFIWQDTGVAVTVGEWFRVCVEVDALGNWRAGIDADGAPGTSGGDDYANYTTFASGMSRDTDGLGGRIADIRGFTVSQGFDDEGDGVATIDPMQLNARAFNAPRPAGISAQQFCFYQIVTVNAGGMTTAIQPVDPVTGSLVGLTRNVGPGDAIAVQFDAAFGVNNFDQCPRNGRFEFRNMADAVVTSGTWVLTGVPDVETAAQPPKGGISNADAIVDGKAYNFDGTATPPGPNAPYRTALLATYRVIPSIPEDEINSRWWLDNLHLQEVTENIPNCPADLNGDGNVNSADLALLLGAWGQSGVPADINGMGGVNSADLALLLGAWGPCPE